MSRLRHTLGDPAYAPRYIETIPKRGYRFIASACHRAHAAPPPGTEQAPHPEAYKAYVKGHLIKRYTSTNAQRGLAYFRQAMRLGPHYGSRITAPPFIT